MSVAISIVSFNTKDLLRNCLKNLKTQTTKEKINVWVLDNDSNDGSSEMVKKEFPAVNLIESERNLGFAKGQNQILKQIRDEYVLLLNPDTQFDSDSIGVMLKFMEENPGCGVSSCRLVDFNNKLESNGGSFPFGWALYSWLFNLEILGLNTNFHQEDSEYYSKVRKVDWVAGTFMMVKTEVFKSVGFLSEDFFMYFEDVEFCYRVKKSGSSVMLNPKVTVKHKSGSSSKDPRFNQWKGEFEGLIKFYKIRMGFLGGVYARILVYKAILLRIIAFFLGGKLVKSRTYAKVLFSI